MRNPKRALISLSAVAGLLLAAPAGLANGTIVIVSGSVNVQRGGEQLSASQGFKLRPGDTITTGRQSRAQVHMQDDSIYALPPLSEFRHEEFQLARSSNDGVGRAIFSMVRGGFRTITGLIGKAQRDVYEVRTGVATIGIRGTTYAAVNCQGNCGNFPDGLYVKDEDGVVFVANNAGRLRLRAGQVAYVASSTTAPVRVKASPFDDPLFAADFSIDLNFDFRVDPPRIEQEPPASPSSP